MAAQEFESTTPSATPTPTAATSTIEAETGLRQRSGERLPHAEATPPTLNQIRYPCLMNMDYHAAREAWLDRVHRWLMFGTIIGGASAFIDALPVMRYIGPVLAGLAGTLDLTFDLSNKARDHALLRRRYSGLLARATREPDRLLSVQCELDEISGEEPPAFNALLAMSAVKAQQQTYGKIHSDCSPGFIRSFFANLMRFGGRDFNQKTRTIASANECS